VPWRKPWKFQPPRNLVSKRPYHGINLLLLTLNEYGSPYYATFNQAKQLGGSIKKGEHGTPVVFWKLLETREKSEENGEEKPKVVPYLQYSTVFNLTQTEGIDAPKDAPQPLEPLAVCEQIIGHCSKASEIRMDKVRKGADTACLNLLSQETLSCSDPVNMCPIPPRASSTSTTCPNPF
jgi:antirestriction protein ArdC